MKLKIIDVKNSEAGSVELPAQFSEPVRADLIARAVLAIQANKRQKYGADPRAGKKHASNISRRRRKYKGSYGKGISRVPRKTMSRNGAQFNWVGAFAPGTRGGRNANPPKAEKNWDQKINDTERRKAIRSALAATVSKEAVEARGHKVPAGYPLVLADDFQVVVKTKDFAAALTTLGFEAELDRASIRKVRAGKGTLRGRKYKTRVGPLVVVADTCEASKAARNIPGVDVVQVAQLNAELLAPGSVPGRATLFTASALTKLKELELFM